MKSKILQTATAIVLSCAMAAMPAASVYAQTQNTAEIKNKTEILYGSLNALGKAGSIYAVNQFEITKGGSVTDYGNYSSVLNLTTTGKLYQEEDKISFSAEEGFFYYQGNLKSQELPWNISLTYTLDGKEITPEELAGKSGKVSLHFTTKKNPAVDSIFYDNYMLQAEFLLNNDNFSKINAPGATIASSGKNTIANLTVMPQKDADFEITATVTDFHMDGVQISGIPLSVSVDLSDTDNIMDDFSQLSDAIHDLNQGVLELKNGAETLSDNASELVNGSAKIETSLNKLNSSSANIINGSGEIKDALSKTAASLNTSTSNMDISSVSTLTQSLTQMADGLNNASDGLSSLNQGYQAAYTALDQAVNTIPDNTLSQNQIKELYALVAKEAPEKAPDMDVLISAYTAAQTVKRTYSGVKEGFYAVGTTIENLIPSLTQMEQGLRDMSTQIETALSSDDISAKLSQLTTGISKLSSNYIDFHNGLVSYIHGIAKLTDGYDDFQSGLTQYGEGIKIFENGIAQLKDGTDELENKTADLPEQVQNQVDDMTAEYNGKDFEPVSFLDSRNNQVGLVQFVLKTANIALPEKTMEVKEEETPVTFWDRLINLFK